MTKVTIHLLAEKGAETRNRKCSSVQQCRTRSLATLAYLLEIGLRCVLFAHEQADDSVQYPLEGYNADLVLLDSY